MSSNESPMEYPVHPAAPPADVGRDRDEGLRVEIVGVQLDDPLSYARMPDNGCGEHDHQHFGVFEIRSP
jgi:hypothetical protein